MYGSLLSLSLSLYTWPSKRSLSCLPVKIVKALLRWTRMVEVRGSNPVQIQIFQLKSNKNFYLILLCLQICLYCTLSILDELYKILSFSSRTLSTFPFSSLLDPNICLRILYSNALSLRSSFNAIDHISQSWNMYICMYVYTYMYLCKYIRICRFTKWKNEFKSTKVDFHHSVDQILT